MKLRRMTAALRPHLWPRLALVILLAALAGALAYGLLRTQIERRLDQTLLLTDRSLQSEVERFRYLPEVAAEDARIRAALANPADPQRIAAANLYLQAITAHAGAEQLYLLDYTGLTIASSNWQNLDSYVGRNYGFRPYFDDALETGNGAVYAIGVTTGQPGYFMSTRLYGPSGELGVLVVKINLRPLEETWAETGQKVAVADADGVVFLSGDPAWRYHPLTPLPAPVRERLARTQIYSGSGLDGASALLRRNGHSLTDGAGRLLTLNRAPFARGWELLAAASLWPARAAALVTGGVVLLAGLLGLALLNLRQHRQRLIALRLRQTEMMERKVDQRTAELNHEIETRRKIEADLRAAQETLVHSEKMAALGRMSAAVVHEVSQPLAAMEATLTAAQLSLSRAPEQTEARLQTAHGLIRRMQRMTRNLKNFARKEVAPTTPVSLNTVTATALELVAPRAQATGVTPQLLPPAADYRVQAGQVRLEQVLVNLLHNAMEAVEPENGEVTLSVTRQGQEICLCVADNGPGIPEDILPRITEPFFSTKTHSEGLGLGLAISREIVLQFGGRLEIDSAPGAGTRVSVMLPELVRETGQ
ncbi:ATP-binding protein [Pseudooceanicola sp. HF7]|uniref:sensor histidine kinase n=1 Tax=Pseudooceanicola sp. HF7 TaxID=2721560 RepID=UPI0014306EAC|nr:ATP-binding protein [Pseudooceanicola sp. HF7]NIZ08497.1 sensor histidine kinase [Pseudooceanicola sp. HF7]